MITMVLLQTTDPIPMVLPQLLISSPRFYLESLSFVPITVGLPQ